jgi:hypothetical protein
VQSVFSIDDKGFAVPELPDEADGRELLTAEQASAITGEPVEKLNARWLSIIGPLLTNDSPAIKLASATKEQGQTIRANAIRVLREQYFPKLLDDQDLLDVFEFARTRNLNIAARHVWAEVKWDAELQRERLFVGVCAEGLRAMAHATGEYAGLDDVTYGFGANGTLQTATATVYRRPTGKEVRDPFTATVFLVDYYPGPGFWDNRERMMLAKCARAAALREAFPAELGGLYDREELARTLNATSGSERGIDRGPRRPAVAKAMEPEVVDRTQFETLLAAELKVTDGKRRSEIICLCRTQFPHLLKGDHAVFWSRAWRAVRTAPEVYGLKSALAKA